MSTVPDAPSDSRDATAARSRPSGSLAREPRAPHTPSQPQPGVHGQPSPPHWAPSALCHSSYVPQASDKVLYKKTKPKKKQLFFFKLKKILAFHFHVEQRDRNKPQQSCKAISKSHLLWKHPKPGSPDAPRAERGRRRAAVPGSLGGRLGRHVARFRLGRQPHALQAKGHVLSSPACDRAPG